jgi:hypothetical protein
MTWSMAFWGARVTALDKPHLSPAKGGLHEDLLYFKTANWRVTLS